MYGRGLLSEGHIRLNPKRTSTKVVIHQLAEPRPAACWAALQMYRHKRGEALEGLSVEYTNTHTYDNYCALLAAQHAAGATACLSLATGIVQGQPVLLLRGSKRKMLPDVLDLFCREYAIIQPIDSEDAQRATGRLVGAPDLQTLQHLWAHARKQCTAVDAGRTLLEGILRCQEP